MYYHVRAIYQQWSNGQSVYECMKRKEDFIALACRHIGYDPDTLRKFLEHQPWFPKDVDDEPR